MAKRKPRLIVIDAHSLIHRAFHALPPLSTADGTVVNAVYGFVLIVFKVLKELKPDYVVVASDAPGPTFRHQQYQAYKATRVKQPQELYDQIPKIKELVHAFGFPLFELAGFEADDIIGTITRLVPPTIDSYIITGDLDALQLIDQHTFVFAMRKGVSDTVTYDAAAVAEKFNGLAVNQLIDYKALRGDPSDNIPGVPGIGEKTAITLLNTYKTVDGIYQQLDTITGAIHKKLAEHKSEAELSKQLATINRVVPVQFKLDDAMVRPYNRDQVVKLLQRYEFKSLLKQLPSFPEANNTTTEPVSAKTDVVDYLKHSQYQLVNSIVQAKALIKQLEQQTSFAVDTETTDLNPLRCQLVGMSVSWENGTGFFITADYVPLFKAILENSAIKKIGHNIKFDYKVLRHTSNITVAGMVCDTMLAAYVLNPGSRGYGLDALAFAEFGYEMMSYDSLVGKGKTAQPITTVPLNKLAFYASEDADMTWRLYQTLLPRIKKNQLAETLQLEVELLPVLAAIETVGVMIDTTWLANMSTQLGDSITRLAKNIYQLAGQEFNIASPKQLSAILFQQLNIDSHGLTKTKTGISTAASELEKMRQLHPIIDLISQYREVTKLKSTYVDALPTLIHPVTQRVHTNYNQTIAATGRLSSTDPNLQNIPIRTDLGKEIRRAFIVPPGKVLLSLDYSQIELRIIAHIAKDDSFIRGFKSGIDIHTQTAAELNGVSSNEVTPQLRRSAKSVNFGLLYGMGTHGLARDTGMSFDEAREYLDKYFSVHPAIKRYIETTKEFAREHGYVQTLFGRKRYLPDIHSGMTQVRAAAERAAINMPIQGTAADLIKLAMLAVQHDISTGDIPALMILQVHDELVFEVDQKNVNKAAKKIKQLMEQVYTLAVPLVADVKAGSNWADTTTLTF
ncbi:MAG: DNA polymerase I [Candidatus Kerfeldbacteria bacterium]|nr:DNA polymerase I [Candidatus Kerfeldbacteria bacterium]